MRINGSVIGSVVTSSASSAIGIWGLQNVEIGNRLNSWPTTVTIVSTGLVLNLDASTYPGSGTTWTDSSNTGNGTLTNGPSYSSTYGGKFSFDAVDDYVAISSRNLSNNFSTEVWCLPNATHGIDSESTSGTAGVSGQRFLISPDNAGGDGGAGISVGTNGISVYEHGSSYIPALLVYETTISSPVHFVVVYTSKQPSLYLNGSLVRTGLTSAKGTVYNISTQIGSYVYGNYSGDVYQVRFYNKSLTSDEVSQNFSATRARFGV